MQAVALADADELADGGAQAVRDPVVVEDGGRAGVRQDVRVALVQVVPRERPVVQRGAGVVVLRAGAARASLGRRAPVCAPPPNSRRSQRRRRRWSSKLAGRRSHTPCSTLASTQA